MRNRLSKETIQKLRMLYEEHLTPADISRKMRIPYSTAYLYTQVFYKNLKSPGEYQVWCARRKGFSYPEYRDYLARGKGFATYFKQRDYLFERNQKKGANRRLSNILKQSLKERGRQAWLAREVNIHEKEVFLYKNGSKIPNKELLGQIFNALNLPYKTLDDILQN